MKEMRENISVALHSLGCPKNQVDAENMLHLIKEAGYQLTAEMAEADAIIINTCGFIEAAKSEAIASILEAAEYKKSAQERKLIVSGCLSQRYAEEIKAELPEVDAILGVYNYHAIVACLDTLFSEKSKADTAEETTVLSYLAGDRADRLKHLQTARMPSSPYYAYLKVSEGCRHHCAYCAIPGIRGGLISRPMEELLTEAEFLLSIGIKELVLVAQDTTAYGLDLYGQSRFAELLDQLAKINFPRIRFLYAYADGMTDDVLKVMQSHSNIVPYIDLPIQHAADSVLKRMYRRDRQAGLRETLAKIRGYLPDVSLRTTVMVAFPGETEEEFKELLAFIEEIRFDHLGCFIYSAEEGTAAASMEGQIDGKIAERRYAEVMRLQEGIHQSKITAMLGQTLDVLIEGLADDGLFYVGRSWAQAPEIDSLTYVLFENTDAQLGQIYPVKLIETQGYDLIGVCKSEPSE